MGYQVPPWWVFRSVASRRAGHGNDGTLGCRCGRVFDTLDDRVLHLTRAAVREGIGDPDVADVVFRLGRARFPGSWEELLVTALAIVRCPPIG